jgi:hypothetical protein
MILYNTISLYNECLMYIEPKNLGDNEDHWFIIHYFDEDDYWYGRVQTGSSGQGVTLTVGYYYYGVATALDTFTDPTYYYTGVSRICLEYNGYDLAMGINEAGPGVWGAIEDNFGRQFGIINNNVTDGNYDNFEVWEHFDRAFNPDCPQCICRCFRNTTPQGPLLATFTATGNCTLWELDEHELTLTREDGDPGYDVEWYGESADAICEEGGVWQVSNVWKLRLQCDIGSLDETRWLLWKEHGSSQCIETGSGGWTFDPLTGFYFAYPASITCNADAFTATFGPFIVTPDVTLGNCDCCAPDDFTGPSGTYTITVTLEP